MRQIFINGRFLNQRITGVQRYAREIIGGLDQIFQSNTEIGSRLRFEILVPPATQVEGLFTNIPIRAVGIFRGHLWEQFELPRYAGSAVILNFANTGPFRRRNQIATIHDASVFAAPAGYSASFRLWYRFLHRNLCRRSIRIVTDSQFSQSEFERHCDLDRGRSTVIPLGAEHILRTPADNSVLEKHSLTPGRFVLAAGSLNPNKNLAALAETARRLGESQLTLAVAGGGNARVFQSSPLDFPKDVKFLGYVSDAELRSLYENARCFVFPSRYEGFGLPPLEAMACGCPVVSSNAASLPEICGTAALMVDPDNPQDLAENVLRVIHDDSLHAVLVRKGKEQASRFSWAKSAGQWLDLIDSLS